MRRTTAISMLVLVALLPATAGACSGDDAPASTPDPSSTTPGAPAAGDPALLELMLQATDLPPGFTASTTVADTITAFCAGEDATAGLQASAREVRGFTRSPGGASVIQLAFHFRGDGAAAFVDHAGAILDRCSGVPDVTGLAFDYAALPADIEALVAAVSDVHVGRHGVNVGSGRLAIDVVVFQHGDVGQLVAVLGVDLPVTELHALASAALTAVTAVMEED
jgi:hypothetical protein